MQTKRAIKLAFAGYLITAIVGIAVAAFAGFDPAEMTKEPPMMLWYINIIVTTLVGFFLAWWYFQAPNTNPSLNEGFRFGGMVILVGFALDFIFLLPAFFDGSAHLILEYYKSPLFWVAIILLVLACGTTGKMMQKN